MSHSGILSGILWASTLVTISCIISLFRNNLSVKSGPCTSRETSKSSYKFREEHDALQRYKIIKSKK